jgi:hypothetical protein
VNEAEAAGGPRWAPWLLALVVLLQLAGLQLAEPRFFLRDDNATHFLPAYEYAFETVAGGEIPLLNHHQMFGGTFLASGQTGVFLFAMYPLRAALGALGVDPVVLIDLLAAVHFVLAALGMFVFLRYLSLRPALAFPLALCWCFLPFGIITSRSWIFVSYLLAYLPWNQWLLQRFLAAPTARLGCLLAGIKAVFIFTGYLHYAVLAFLMEAVFVLLHFLAEKWDQALWRKIGALGAVYLVAGLLAAPLLVPTWNAKEASRNRSQPLPKEIALSSAVEPAELAAAQLFRPAKTVYSDLSTAVYFLGPLWILGTAGAFWRLRRRGAGDLGTWLATGIFALLASTSLYGLLFELPFFSLLRWPFKGFPLAAFFLFLPAATMAAAWSAERAGRARLVLALAWLNLLLQLALLFPPAWRAPIGAWTMDRTVAELRAAPLLQAIGVDGRVVMLTAEDEPPGHGEPISLAFLYATLAGKYHVHGYDPLVASINAEMGFQIGNSGAIPVVKEGWPQLLPSLPRYLILAATSSLLPRAEATPTLRRLAVAEGFVVYENTGALPIVGWMEERRPIPFRWRANGVEAELPPEFTGGHLLFNFAGLDGYRVFVDGEALGEPELAHNRPIVEVPPGQHRVELRYVDRGFLLGVGLCLSGLLALLLALRKGALRQAKMRKDK